LRARNFGFHHHQMREKVSCMGTEPGKSSKLTCSRMISGLKIAQIRKIKLKFQFFNCDSYRDTSNRRARFTLNDRHTGMTLGEIAA